MIVSLGDAGGQPSGPDDGGGLAAYDRFTGEQLWRVPGVPALAAVGGGRVYCYARTGVVVALDLRGAELWRAFVPDDRSAEGIARRDRAAPFVADALADETSIVLAAGARLLRLAARDGEVAARVSLAHGEGGVIARLAGTMDGGFVATSTERSDRDDELYAPLASIWHRAPAPDAWRTGAGHLVAVDADFRVRWCVPPPRPNVVFGDRRPAVDRRGRVALVAARVAGAGGSRRVSDFDDCVVCVDAASGDALWLREAAGGRGYVDPVVADGGLVAGYDPTCYDLDGGAVRWRLSARALELNRHVAPLVEGRRLLYVANRRLLAVSAAEGSATTLAPLPVDASGDALTTPLALAGERVYFGLQPSGRPSGLGVVDLSGHGGSPVEGRGPG